MIPNPKIDMRTLEYTIVPVTDFSQNCTLLRCLATNEMAIIDPGGEAEKLIQLVQQQGANPTKILLTHGHLDHVGAASALAAHWQIPIIGPHDADKFWLDALPEQSQMFGFAYCAPLQPDHWLGDGESLVLGRVSLQVKHCPGHTPGHIVFFVASENLLISGDVLFRGGVGRSDFPQGNHQQLIDSIKQKLLPLGDEVTFLPGHGAISTLGEEKRNNPFLLA